MKVGVASKFQVENGILVSCIAAYVGKPIPPTVHALVRTCKKFGVQIRLFAVDKEYRGFYETKLVELQRCFESCQVEYKWVLNIDAFDCVMIRPLEEIFDQCLKFPSGRMIFAAERNCYPDPSMHYAECHNSYRYLNGGCFWSDMQLAVHCFRFHRPNRFNCDQYAWSLAYNSGQPIVLDHECKVFQTLWGHSEDEFDEVNGQLRNKETLQHPCIVHGNGSNYQHPIMRRYW